MSGLFGDLDLPDAFEIGRRARARRTDPETSHEAARSVEICGTAADQRRKCLQAVREAPGSTAAEIAEVLGMERHAPSRRLPELRESGWICNGKARVCRIQGRSSLTWWPA